LNGSNGVPNADDSLPPNGPALHRAFEALVDVLAQHFAIELLKNIREFTDHRLTTIQFEDILGHGRDKG
jgi:hypothetical protein